MPVSAIGAAVSQQLTYVHEEALKPLFQRVKELILRIWAAVLMGIEAIGGKAGFAFFRFLEWVNPTWGPRLESAALRLQNVWQATKAAWKQEETHRAIERIVGENRDLRYEIENLAQVAQQCEEQREKADRLQREKGLLEQRLDAQAAQQHNIIGREQAVVQDRDVLVARCEELEAQKADLQIQLKEKSELYEALVKLHANLSGELQNAAQTIRDLQQQKELSEQMKQNIAQVGAALAKIEPGAGSQLDLELNQLLPLLLQQITTAQEKLALAKENIQEHSSADIALCSLERILKELKASLEGIPQMFQMHSGWQNPLRALWVEA